MTNTTYRNNLERMVAEQQAMQMVNPPTSEAWISASQEIHRLAELLRVSSPSYIIAERSVDRSQRSIRREVR